MKSVTKQRRRIVSEELGSIIRERADELGISLSEVARRAGMVPQNLNRVLQGESAPMLPKVEAIAEALEMRLELVKK